ncbi:MAG: hypothetical protein F6K03_14140 [Kamptonema sp. SIO4C4]|nr:hypothetical protein [Kamptonema sp. SIO4C4]
MIQTKEATPTPSLSITNVVKTTEAAESMTSSRPWGTFTVLEEGAGYKIKRIEVKPGHRLSFQMHHHRSEHWIVVSGTAKVTCGEKEEILARDRKS